VTITVVGINEVADGIQSIFPNPTNGVVQITTHAAFAKAEWSLMNGIGQLVSQGQLNGTVSSLDFSELPQGQYMLQMRNEHRMQTVQLIIE
jgi:hypothetical protein